MKITNIKSKLVMGLAFSTVVLFGCQGSRNNSNGTPAAGQRPYLPGQMGNNGVNRNDPNGLNNLNGKGDDIVFPTDKDKQVSYDPTNYTHVVNPNAVAVKTGYGRSELLDYTDAGDDNIMERLKIKLGTRTAAIDEKTKADDKDRLNSSIQGEKENFARGIINASLTKGLNESKYSLKVSTADFGDLTFTTDVSDLNSKNTVKNVAMDVDSESDNSDALTATLTCVANSTRDACTTAVVNLRKNNAEAEAYIVFRSSPANLYLGEYTSKLMLKPQGDPIVDRWVQFFAQVMDYRYIVGSTEGQNHIADIKSFAVVNGIAGFELNINRSGYAPFVLSGKLEVSKRGNAFALNTSLDKRPLEESNSPNYEDIMSETLQSATLVHNNGRGMLQIGLQLHGFNDLSSGGNNGSVIMNEKAIKSLDRRNQPYNQGNQAYRTKSSRLQDKSNRALRITIVPIRNFGVKETLL